MDNLKKKTLSGFAYVFLERGAAKGIAFVIQVILARILVPEEFGTVALLLVLTNILDVFVTYGFGNSLIVNKKSDDLDFSTCFYFALGLSLVTYLLVFFTSPYISVFFCNTNELDTLIKVLALRTPIAAVNSVQYAHVSKKMQFKLFFYATLIGTILSGIISIIMAYTGFGVWSLVAQYLTNALFNTISLWIFAKWRPKMMFSFSRLKSIYDYGWKILIVGLVDSLYGQLRSLVIAKQYTRTDLAQYNRGTSFPHLGMNLLEPTISNVLFPALSNCNDDTQMMRSVTQRVIKSSTYLTCAFMALLFGIAKPLVLVLLTEKWLPCVVFLQIGCVAYFLRPMQLINNCVIRASGKSGLLLKLDLLKKAIGILLLVGSMKYGVAAIAWSYVFTNLISTFINIFPNRDILHYGFREQFRDLCANMWVGIIMGAVIYALTYVPMPSIIILLIQCLVAVILFVGLSELLSVESYTYLKSLVKGYNKK